LGRNRLIVLVLVAVLSITAAAIAVSVYLKIPVFTIHGKIAVSPAKPNTTPVPISIELSIDKPKGSKVYSNVALLSIPENYCIQFYPHLANITGNVEFTLNGRIVLEPKTPTGKKYDILAPCIAANTPCYRIQMVIPGYDTPLRIAPGDYTVSTEDDHLAQIDECTHSGSRLIDRRRHRC